MLRNLRSGPPRKVVYNSLPIAHVAREVGVSGTTLAWWVKDYRKRLLRQPLSQDIPVQVRIRELERRNRELEVENAFLKRAAYLCLEWQLAESR